ncbi:MULTISPECIES: hypothetical protein [Chryseobacterium]|uniref:Transposase n=1 Tax=Chryseobacterium camelliae TaxID=1265445 RepID=A0ABU0TMZ7_9FLAO|nr:MULTISPECIES: hypothetical protein [Chryseobacterium]MDT3407722.1 hypothetical protein [Pseudacidovorax intermedius]MDQ1098426.1 hypothetical protein [Chryseobacterium camelliae]MDQ1102350.1 hypothetical protein [Chryseobacterium sp. SORGH_AS_1048]MDR6085787.1 hypothetical protein [Chryseobacterium sp. SORGH_AS_0909]MDR6130150.1 hypothetical protein [Chryseobacterium sp. SORGH_AS_1175]
MSRIPAGNPSIPDCLLAIALIAAEIPEWCGGAKRSRAMRNCSGKQVPGS